MSDSATLKSLNHMLATQQNRAETQSNLKNFLNGCSDQVFIDNCLRWMQTCCRLDGKDVNADLAAIQNLSQLFEMSSAFPELSRPVANSVIPRFFDIFFKYFDKGNDFWDCLQIILTKYNGPCASFKDKLEGILNDFLTGERSIQISKSISQCWALLPSVGGGGSGGVNHKTNWTSQMRCFIHRGHLVLNNLFEDVTLKGWQPLINESSGDKFVAAESVSELIVQFENICQVLQSMFLGKYSAIKSFKPEEPLELICRGLTVNNLSLGKQVELTSVADLRKVLPHLHSILLKLLSTLIVCASRNLVIKSQLIVKLIKQNILESEHIQSKYEHNNDYVKLRCAIYSTICNWLIVTQSGSCLDKISKMILDSLLFDMVYEKPTVTLSKNSTKSEPVRGKLIDWIKNEKVCLTALKTMSLFLDYHGFMLPPFQQKTVQEVIIRQLVSIQRLKRSGEIVPVYSNSDTCRLELYSLLLKLCLEPCTKWPPPTQFALKIFTYGVTEKNIKIAEFSSYALSAIGHILRPEYSVAAFPVNYKDVLKSNGTFERPVVIDDGEPIVIDDREPIVIDEREPIVIDEREPDVIVFSYSTDEAEDCNKKTTDLKAAKSVEIISAPVNVNTEIKAAEEQKCVKEVEPVRIVTISEELIETSDVQSHNVSDNKPPKDADDVPTKRLKLSYKEPMDTPINPNNEETKNSTEMMAEVEIIKSNDSFEVNSIDCGEHTDVRIMNLRSGRVISSPILKSKKLQSPSRSSSETRESTATNCPSSKHNKSTDEDETEVFSSFQDVLNDSPDD